jgi:hypothetical protein
MARSPFGSFIPTFLVFFKFHSQQLAEVEAPDDQVPLFTRIGHRARRCLNHITTHIIIIMSQHRLSLQPIPHVQMFPQLGRRLKGFSARRSYHPVKQVLKHSSWVLAITGVHRRCLDDGASGCNQPVEALPL